MKYNIAIAGGIGSGKSTIIKAMQLYLPNIQYFSLDDIVDEMWRTHEWQQQMIHEFGHSNRKTISSLVFNDSSIKEQVYKMSQSYLDSKVKKILTRETFKIVEFPILFEQQMDHMFDLVIHITAPEQMRIDRAMKRDNRTIESVKAIMDHQWPDSEKSALSDIVVYNDGENTVETIVKELSHTIFSSIIEPYKYTVTI